MSTYVAGQKTRDLRQILAEDYESVIVKISTRTEWPGYRSVVWFGDEDHLTPAAGKLRDVLGKDLAEIYRVVRNDNVAQYTALIIYWAGAKLPGGTGVRA